MLRCWFDFLTHFRTKSIWRPLSWRRVSAIPGDHLTNSTQLPMPIVRIGKVLVVSPVSLVQNWKKEFHKW
jgi:SNF2 family DNA or RNA helicase